MPHKSVLDTGGGALELVHRGKSLSEPQNIEQGTQNVEVQTESYLLISDLRHSSFLVLRFDIPLYSVLLAPVRAPRVQ